MAELWEKMVYFHNLDRYQRGDDQLLSRLENFDDDVEQASDLDDYYSEGVDDLKEELLREAKRPQATQEQPRSKRLRIINDSDDD